jgi:hypothetical protein
MLHEEMGTGRVGGLALWTGLLFNLGPVQACVVKQLHDAANYLPYPSTNLCAAKKRIPRRI